MKNRMTLRKIAVITGLSMVVMTAVAGFTMGGIFTELFEMSKPEFTKEISNLKENFLHGILGWIAILISDVIVSWGVYRFYAEENQGKALVTGILRLIYSMILIVAIVQLIRSYFVLSGSSIDFNNAYTLLFSFQSIWQFGLIFFGLHLLYLARLVCKKRTIRQVIAAMLFLAGLGYVGSNIADLFIVDYEQIRPQVEMYFILPMVLGEFSLAIWLLVKGGRKTKAVKTQCASGFC